MENQAEEEDFRDTDKPRYAYANQNMEDEDIAYPEQIPMEKMQYAQEGQNTENAQYPEEKLPPIYAKEIESVKETTEHQIKYFEPIQISSDQDVGKFLQSGQLMQQIAPKILALKQETQNQNISNDPFVQTKVTYDEIKQNIAIYNNPENNEDSQSKSLQNSQNEKLNATSSYTNNRFALGQQANNEMSKTQKFNKNNNVNLEGPGGIKYSSILPPKYADKVITIDEYGNRQEEENNRLQEENNRLEEESQISQIQGEIDEDPEDNDETISQKEQQKQRNQMLERRKLQQEQLTQQNILQQKYQRQQLEQQKLQQQRLQQQQLQQQRLQQQQLQQQQLQQQQLKQQQLQQQQLI